MFKNCWRVSVHEEKEELAARSGDPRYLTAAVTLETLRARQILTCSYD